MAKVGRASRNASLVRMETITADKTILPAESGEVYLLNAAASTITLPALKEGYYTRIVVGTTLENNASLIRIVSPSGKMEGGAFTQIIAGASGFVRATVASDLVFKVTSSAASGNGVYAGSTIDIYCDGARWHVHAQIYSKGTTTTAFAAS